MKKKLLLFIVLLMTVVTNVNAEDNVNAWNKSFEQNGFKYTINTIKLDIYKRDGKNSTSADDFKNLVDTVYLSPSDYTIDPVAIESDIKEDNSNVISKGTFVDLNLSLTGQNIKDYMVNKFGDPVETTYTFTVSIDYNISQIPTSYSHIYYVSLYDTFANYSNESYIFPEIQLNENKTQIISSGYYYQALYPGEGAEVEAEEGLYAFKYYESATEDLYAYNYMLLTKEELVKLTSDFPSDSYVFMLHNKDNIENAINNFNTITNMDSSDLESDNNSNTEQINNDQVVEVEDTALNMSTVLIILGSLIIVVGTCILVKTITTKKSEV